MTIPGKTRRPPRAGKARIERTVCYSVSAFHIGGPPFCGKPRAVARTSAAREPAFPHVTASLSPNPTPLRHASLFRSGLGFRLALAAGLVLPLWFAILWATA